MSFSPSLFRVIVEVAGGKNHVNCNHLLGDATVEFTIDGCDPSYYKHDATQTAVSSTYEVPAHKINARVTNLESNNGDRTEILKKLRTIVHTINLKNIGEVDEHTKQPQDGSDLNMDLSAAAEANEELEASEKEVKTIRFVRIQASFLSHTLTTHMPTFLRSNMMAH